MLRWLKNRTILIIMSSLTLFLIAVFGILYLYVDHESTQTITQIGEHYVSTLSNQISIHFESIIDLRFSQVQQVGREMELHAEEDMIEQRVDEEILRQDFSSMAFYTDTGEFIQLYGSPFTPFRLSSFQELVPKGELDISSGTDEDGVRVIVLSAPVNLIYENERAISLVCTLPVSYFKESLHLESDETDSVSYFIRRDGSFVIRTYEDLGLAQETDFFSLFLNNQDQGTINALKEAINNGEVYSSLLKSDSWFHLYETPLPHSNWYLVTLVPFGQVDTSINRMEWILASSSALIVLILIAAAGILVLYGVQALYNQRKEVEKEKETVEHGMQEIQTLDSMMLDLQQPLQFALNEIEEAKNHPGQPAQFQKRLNTASGTLGYLLNQLKQALTLRSQANQIIYQEQISLLWTIYHAIELVKPVLQLKNQTLSFAVDCPWINLAYGDPNQIGQIFIDAFGAASSFTPADQTVKASLKEESVNNHYNRLIITIQAPTLGPDLEKDPHKWNYNLEKLQLILAHFNGGIKISEDQKEVELSFELEKSFQNTSRPRLSGKALLIEPDDFSSVSHQNTLEFMGLDSTRLDKVDEKFLRSLEEQDYQLILLDDKLVEKRAEIDQILAEKGFSIPVVLFGDNPEDSFMASRYFFVEELYPKLKPALVNQPAKKNQSK